MIPYSYNMVDMGGIDLAEANDTEVPGVYEKIVESMNLCGDLILYNWKFAGINIAPSACTVLQQADSILINGLIQVTELDLVTVIGMPPPIAPVSPLEATENGLYEAEPPKSGFNPVRVSVPDRIPIIEPLDVTQNGIYTTPTGVDGFSPITVSVDSLEPFPISTKAGDFTTGWYGSRTIRRVLQEGNLVMARYRWNNGYAVGAFYSLRDYPIGDVITGDYAAKQSIDISFIDIGYSTLYIYGGMNGGGNNAQITLAINSNPIYFSVPNAVGENIATGPTTESNFGNPFNSMSNSLKEKFWSSVLKTI